MNPRVVDFMDEDLFADEKFIEELLATTLRGCEFDIWRWRVFASSDSSWETKSSLYSNLGAKSS